MPQIKDFNRQDIEVNDIVKLKENNSGLYRIIKADNEIIQISNGFKVYNVWCKNVIKI